MANINDIINLAKADGGKFFVIDENGEASLVIMSVEEYERLLLGRLEDVAEDAENINEQITKAQLEEPLTEPDIEKAFKQPLGPKVYGSRIERPDLRSEVIDPGFDFESPRMDDDF